MKSATNTTKTKGIMVRTELKSISKCRHVHSTTMTVLVEQQTQCFIKTMSLPTDLCARYKGEFVNFVAP